MTICEVFAKNTRAERERQGLSQEELAVKAQIHRTYLSGIETGDRNPTLVVVARIAQALHVSVASLLAEGGRR